MRAASKPSPAEETAERRYRRHAVDVEVSLTSDSNFYLGFTENISEGGLFIATYDSAPMGADVEFDLRLPGMSDAVTCRGVVKWIREYNPDCTDVEPGMGIMFKDLTAKTEAVIKHFVRSRDALFYDEF